MTVTEMLHTAGFSAYLYGYGAIDSWLGRTGSANVQILTNADAADLARLFGNIRYPGIGIADAALDDKEQTWYFHSADSIMDDNPSRRLLRFYQDCKTRVFYDPVGIYPLLVEIRRGIRGTANAPEMLRDDINPSCERSRALMDSALILSKYVPWDSDAEWYIKTTAESLQKGSFREGPPPGQEEQRLLLCELITSPNPAPGLELLKVCGFIGEFWPELAILDEADHTKEFHPEGNAWKHTMETFRYRKSGARTNYGYDLRLSLGLLLHDSGKPIAVSTGSRRFDGHAELGESQARRFMERLGFEAALTRDVCFLVRNHMLPAALPRLPLYRTGEIMLSELFPVLLELYRCDESSSFKGLDGYYESAAAYQQFLRNRRNPYRSPDGKKLSPKNLSGASVIY